VRLAGRPRLTVFGHVEQDFGGVTPESGPGVDERGGPGPVVAVVLVPAIWIVQIGQRQGEYPVCFCGVDRMNAAGLAPIGDDCGDVEARDADMAARKGDQRVDAAWVEADFFGCFPQGSGGGISVDGLPGAAGECDLTWMVPKRITALQQNDFGTIVGVFEKHEDGRLPVSDICRNRVIGVELARWGGTERGNESNKSTGNIGGVILWSGCGQPVVHGVRRRRGRIVAHAGRAGCAFAIITASFGDSSCLRAFLICGLDLGSRPPQRAPGRVWRSVRF
jgi:hypothetical protein